MQADFSHTAYSHDKAVPVKNALSVMALDISKGLHRSKGVSHSSTIRTINMDNIHMPLKCGFHRHHQICIILFAGCGNNPAIGQLFFIAVKITDKQIRLYSKTDTVPLPAVRCNYNSTLRNMNSAVIINISPAENNTYHLPLISHSLIFLASSNISQ